MNEYAYIPLSLISFSLVYIFLSKTKLISSVEPTGNVRSITGLRGLLSVMVAFSHFYIFSISANAGADLPSKEILAISLKNAEINYGKIGVSMFFMISGFLFYKLINTPIMDVKRFIISRSLRIIPLYFFVTSVVFMISILTAHNIDTNELIKSLLRWLLFFGNYDISGVNSSDITSGVEWTLRIEIMLYVSIPILFLVNRKKRYAPRKYLSVIISILVIFLISAVIRIYGHVYTDPRPVIAFFSGFLANEIGALAKNTPSKIANTSITILFVASIITSSVSYMYIPFIIILTYPYILISQGFDAFGFLSVKLISIIGEISYSIYLTHGIILYLLGGTIEKAIILAPDLVFVACPVYLIIVILTSKFTYTYIEKPFINMHRLIIKHQRE